MDRPEAHDEEADMTVQWYPIADAVRGFSAARSSIPLQWPGSWRHYAVREGHRRAAAGGCAVDRQVDGVRARKAAPVTMRAGTAREEPGDWTGPVTTLAPPLEGQLQGYLDHLTIERGVAANTLSSYRRDLRRYFEHLTVRGVDDLAKVSEDDVSEFLMALRRGDPDFRRRHRCRRCRRPGP